MRTLLPDLKGMQHWEPANQHAHQRFGAWLRETGGSASTVRLYGIASRIVFGLIDKPWKLIDPDADLQRVRAFIAGSDLAPASQATYLKGVDKFEQFLRLRWGHDPHQKALNWANYVGTLPAWAAESIQAYVAQRCRSLPLEKRYPLSMSLASHVTRFPRWLVERHLLTSIEGLAPRQWRQYVDYRMGEQERTPATLNVELAAVLGWLRYLSEEGEPVNPKLLALRRQRVGPHLPKDMPISVLQKLLDAIRADAEGTDRHHARLGKLDLAWCLLMLHSGLRTCEVRRLKLSDVDFERRLVRIEQSKGLKDRLVPLSEPTMRAIQAHVAEKGPTTNHPDVLFVFRHAPLCAYYCYHRLQLRYAKRIGVHITPHQLRHSCATLLLNAGAPITTVKQVLGHQQIDTTLGYARLYDGTIAADFYRAMRRVEQQIRLADTDHAAVQLPRPARMLALVDALRAGTLNPEQVETLSELRAEIVSLSQPL